MATTKVLNILGKHGAELPDEKKELPVLSLLGRLNDIAMLCAREPLLMEALESKQDDRSYATVLVSAESTSPIIDFSTMKGKLSDLLRDTIGKDKFNVDQIANDTTEALADYAITRAKEKTWYYSPKGINPDKIKIWDDILAKLEKKDFEAVKTILSTQIDPTHRFGQIVLDFAKNIGITPTPAPAPTEPCQSWRDLP